MTKKAKCGILVTMMSDKNRFDLEEAIGEMAQLGSDIDTILHAYMDSPTPATEDEMANMLIGVKQLNEVRFQKMWGIFEELIQNGTISNKKVTENGGQ